jgi:hypothetical protein
MKYTLVYGGDTLELSDKVVARLERVAGLLGKSPLETLRLLIDLGLEDNDIPDWSDATQEEVGA